MASSAQSSTLASLMGSQQFAPVPKANYPAKMLWGPGNNNSLAPNNLSAVRAPDAMLQHHMVIVIVVIGAIGYGLWHINAKRG